MSRGIAPLLAPAGVALLLAVSWPALPDTPDATAAAGEVDADGQAPSPPPRRPNDPLFRHQFHLPAIQIPAAWAVSRGEGAVVAVLDTGVAYQSRGRYRRAPDLAGTRFVKGWDFVDDDPYPNDVPPAGDVRSHGTHVAGVIAQTTGNAIGGAGVAPEAGIMPIRVLRPDRTGSARVIARGLRFAADHGADVANLSIAGPSPARALKRALDYAEAKGVTVVAAAGNGGRPSVGWPAAYPDVVAVGAVAQDLTRARYSNYGGSLDLVAPAGAGDLLDTGFGPADGVPAQTLKGGPRDFCFCFMASTSAAAAEVSGVAALLVASGRARSPAKVRAALISGARDLGARGRDVEHGAGLVQARRALSVARPEASATRTRDKDSSLALWLTFSATGAVLAVLLGYVLVTRRRRGEAA